MEIKWLRAKLLLLSLLLLLVTLGSNWLSTEEEYLRIESPDAAYVAVVSYKHYHAFLPRFPGQSGDKPGYIEIKDSNGKRYGRIPVVMVSLAHELQWSNTGAKLKLVGQWDFSTKEYRYWNADQSELIVKKAR